MVLDQRRQSYRWVPEELGAHHGVEEIRKGEAAVALENKNIVLGGMEEHSHVRGGKNRAKRGQIRRAAQGQGVYQPGMIPGRDLDEASLVEVVVETVGLGVEGDDLLFEKVLGECFEFLRFSDDVEVGHARLCSLVHFARSRRPHGMNSVAYGGPCRKSRKSSGPADASRGEGASKPALGPRVKSWRFR